MLVPQEVDVVEPEATAGGEDYYFEVLELQPIKLTISFMRTERVSSDEKYVDNLYSSIYSLIYLAISRMGIRNPFAVVLNAVTMAVGNINDAPLEMNALAIKDMRLNLPELQQRIMYHYRQEVLRQLYRILGSADFIGNPVGLFTNVSSGVADIFYEPFNGAVMHGDRDFGVGIAKVRLQDLLHFAFIKRFGHREQQVSLRKPCSVSLIVSRESQVVLARVSPHNHFGQDIPDLILPQDCLPQPSIPSIKCVDASPSVVTSLVMRCEPFTEVNLRHSTELHH